MNNNGLNSKVSQNPWVQMNPLNPLLRGPCSTNCSDGRINVGSAFAPFISSIRKTKRTKKKSIQSFRWWNLCTHPTETLLLPLTLITKIFLMWEIYQDHKVFSKWFHIITEWKKISGILKIVSFLIYQTFIKIWGLFQKYNVVLKVNFDLLRKHNLCSRV